MYIYHIHIRLYMIINEMLWHMQDKTVPSDVFPYKLHRLICPSLLYMQLDG